MYEHFILARLGIREVLEARYRAKGVQNGSLHRRPASRANLVTTDPSQAVLAAA
jgi:hypothetical protein